MSTVLMVYLAGIAGSISATLFGVGFVSLIIYALLGGIAISDGVKFERLHPKKTISAILTCLLISVLIPPEKTIYMMAVASIAQDIASNPKTIVTMDKVYKIIDKKLEEQLLEGIDKATKKIENKVEETVK